MAYPAIVSLAQTIDQILNHGQYSISSDVKQNIISLQKLVLSLQASLEVFPESAKSLEGQIRDLGNEAEDIIEYLMLELVSSSHGAVPERNPSGNYEHQLKKATKDLESIAGEVTEIKDSFRSKDGAGSSGPRAASIHKDVVVGFEDDVLAIKDRLCGATSKLQVIPICGMGGIGKTTLAQSVYDDPLTVDHFDVRVWVTISQDYTVERILSSILDSMKEFDTGRLGITNEEKIHKILMGRRYLVVMDDMWSVKAWDAVRNVFPDDGNRSRIILTTRLTDVASYPDPSSDRHEIRLMDADLSWDLLKKKVFSNEACPSELEIIGKEIARSCKGLPLAIVVIAGVLSTVGKNPASWEEIADNVKSADTTAEKGQIEEILSLSYTHLPQYLRPCFLYMGLFPEDHEIRVSNLAKLWVAEGFLKHPNGSRTLEDEAESCLEDLIRRSLALVTKRKWDGRVKSCRLHDLMRDLCIRKAYESKFSVNLIGKNVEKENLIEKTKNQRRLSVDPHNLKQLSSTHGSTIHTILLSKYYEFLRVVVLDFVESVRLLRVLDAETADIESLPSQLFELFHLRYLAFRYDFDIPRTISKLQNLQTLIIYAEIRPHFYEGVPLERNMKEIWKMPQLRHLYSQVTIGLYEEGNTPLQHLHTLSVLSYNSCTERIFRMIPNLKKLVINCFSFSRRGPKACLNDLVHLHQLEDLEIYDGSPLNNPTGYSLTFPRMLRKLTLNSMEFPWGEMTAIVGSLPNLQVLKIRNLFRAGETWETLDGGFLKLEVLLVQGSNLQYWITESDHFPILRRLVLHHCPLHEIPQGIGEISTLEVIEVRGKMKKSLGESLAKIVEEQQSYGNYDFQVRTD